MLTTYINTKNEVSEIAKLKPNFRNVILQLNERAIAKGYNQLEVDLYNDKVADPVYAFQGRGLTFRFKFEKEGQRTTWEHWTINAKAFKRGSLSGLPIKIEIQIPDESNDYKYIVDYI